MTFTITNLDGRTLNEVVLDASIEDASLVTRAGDLDSDVESEHPLSREVFLPLLEEWISLCKRYNVEYSIFWGTLLGQLRNQRIIPYDQDIDVVVGKSGLNTIYGLPGSAPGCVFNNELKDQPAWKDHEIRLVVRKDLVSPDGPRFDHLGQLTPVQVDACSFNGPLARLIIKLPAGFTGREYWHLDVDLFTDITRFNPYPAIHEVDELPELEYRPLEGLQVSCLKHPLPYVEGYYGNDFMTPDHVYRDGEWIRRAKRRFTIGMVATATQTGCILPFERCFYIIRKLSIGLKSLWPAAIPMVRMPNGSGCSWRASLAIDTFLLSALRAPPFATSSSRKLAVTSWSTSIVMP